MRSRLSVFWVRADDLANFLDDFSQIMNVMEPSNDELSTSQDRSLLARRVTARLERDPNSWLLVLDNADNFDRYIGIAGDRNAISNYVPKEGRVLITTRDRRFQGMVAAAKNGLEVKPMDTSEARDLFMKSIPPYLASQHSPAIVDELLDLLGNLPLALAQAAANITDQQRPVQEYVAAYRDKRNRISLMEKPTMDLETQDSRTSRQSILVTYEISFEDIERDDQLSARCLNYFGFFHWQKLPEPCLRALPGLRELDNQSFRDTIKRLLHLSLVEEIVNHNGNEYFVHPVVHERISDRLSLEEKRSYLGDSIAVILSNFPIIRSYNEREQLITCRYLQSHVLMQIDLAIEIEMRTEELARLIQRCARFLRRSGITSDSVRLATQAVAIGQELWGPHSRLIIDACVEKTACLIADTRYREGFNESTSAMERLNLAELDTKTLGNIHTMTLRQGILKQRLFACRRLGDYKEAEAIANELLLLSTDLSEDSLDSLNDRYTVSLILFDMGRLQEAQKMNNELLSLINTQDQTASKGIFLKAYSLKAEILREMRTGSDAEPAMILNDDEEEAILRILQYVFDEYQATLDITNLKLWASCNSLLGELKAKGRTQDAAQILVSILSKAVDPRLYLEGQTLDIFSKISVTGLSVIDSLHGTRDARKSPPGLPIAKLFMRIIELASITSGRNWHGSSALHVVSMLFQRLGKSHKVEEFLLKALQNINLKEYRSREGLIHYSLMLALARHGRIDDSRRYRDTHLSLITPEESKYDHLDSILRQDREEKELYDKAKGIIAAQRSKVSERWWTENRIALNRAQLRYGLLVPEKAEGDQGPYENALDPTRKTQKGKSRGLGSVIGKLHRSRPSSPHT